MARYTVLSETNNIDTNWSTYITLLSDLEHRCSGRVGNSCSPIGTTEMTEKETTW